MSKTPIYKVWVGVRERCGDPRHPQYKNYGARGITVCERWFNSFENFFADMGATYRRGLSLDRANNNEGYCKENCRWVTMTVQARNKRNNHLLTVNGQTKCIGEWAKIYGIGPDTIRVRLRCRWSSQDAVTKPIDKSKWHKTGAKAKAA